MSRLLLSIAVLFALLAPAHPVEAATPAEEARIELTTYAALFGAGLGAFTAYELDLNLRPAIWLSAALTTGAIWGTWEAAAAADLQPNQAALISSTAGWTMVETLMICGLFSTGQGPEKAIWLTFGTGAAAAGISYWLAPGYDTSLGDLSLINSGGLWMPVATTLLMVPAIDAVFDDPFLYVLMTTAAGLGIGGLASTHVQPSREQVLYMDAGLGIGLLGGSMLGVIGTILTDSIEVGALVALGGMIAGGVVAISAAGFDGGAERDPVVQAESAVRARREPIPVPLWVGTW